MQPQQQQEEGQPAADRLVTALLHNFGHSSFRAGQRDAVEATLSGRDSLLILPTGGGKSMTFQLPALAKGGCFTVVVGPLMALAKDQVDSCLELGIDARVWNSDTSEDARRQVLSELVTDEPEMRLLYTTPESLRNATLRSYLQEAYSAGTLLSFAIDEAHCVSEWGADFRPSYLELASLKTDFPCTPIAALTATCTPSVEASIIKLLRLQEPLIIRGGFNRPNISYTVLFKELIGGGKQDDLIEHLIQFIQERQGQCGIIYCRLRSTCDLLGAALAGRDLEAGVYHAGRDAARRRKVQGDWCSGALDVIVATIAFGMGIDKADVRWVVHWDAPASLEGFYQESGRAGRDGLPSESLVLVSADDLDTIAKLEKGSRAGATAAVASFSCAPGCRRRKVLAHFGDVRGPCDASRRELPCDYCREPRAVQRLIQQWERQIQRRAVQHMLREQGLGGAGEGADGGGVGGGDGEQEHGAAMCQQEGQQQQQERQQEWQRQRQRRQPLAARRGPGVWGPAGAHAASDAPAAPPAAAGAAEAAAAAVATTATGVRPPQPQGRAVVPQLARKRPMARQQLGPGAFKAPRMLAAEGGAGARGEHAAAAAAGGGGTAAAATTAGEGPRQGRPSSRQAFVPPVRR